MTLKDILEIYGVDYSTLVFKSDAEDLTEEEIRTAIEENEITIQIDTYSRKGISVKKYEMMDMDILDKDEGTIIYGEVFRP